MSGLQDYGTELADFRRRVDDFRAVRALPSHERLAALDAALFELEHVADVLWPRYQELAASVRNASPARGDSNEQRLLRALFQRLPLASVLMDRDTVVRRMNFAATRLFHTRAGYATGRPLTASLRRDGWAVLRSQVAAVARGEGDRSLVVHLPHSTADGALHVTLTALRPPDEPTAAVLSVFQPAATPRAGSPRPGAVPAPAPAVDTGRDAESAGTPPADGEPGAGPVPPRGGWPAVEPDLAEVTRNTELMDLVDEMTMALLAAGGDGPDATLVRAAGVLHGRFADWVVIDVVPDPSDPTAPARPADATDGAGLRRAVVLGPPGVATGRTSSLADQDPASCPLVVEAVRDGTSALSVRPADGDAFGRDAEDAPMLVREEVTSLLCVPLRARQSAPVQGALTLFRIAGRRAFEMAEAGVTDRMARHVALARALAAESPRGVGPDAA